MKTFEQRWNLRTIKKIRAEFAASGADFLCLGSETFRALWFDHKDALVELGTAWNERAATPSILIELRYRLLLFYKAEGGERHHSVRLAWLDHEIAKRQKRRKAAK